MNKQEHTLLILILATAGMLLLLLYSPWGSPDIYTKKAYFAENQGVNFSKINIGRSSFQVNSLKSGPVAIKANVSSYKTIENAPKNGDIGSSENNEIKVEDNYSKRKSENKYSVTRYPDSPKQGNRIIAYNTIANSKKITKIQNESASGNSTSYSGASSSSNNNGQSTGSLSNINNRAQTIDTSKGIVSGVSTLNVDLTMFNDSTTMLGMDSAQRGASDPGDEPLGEPVPVGEGWIILLVLAGFYIVVKRKLILNKCVL